MNKKSNYQPPRIEIIRMENEGGVMSASLTQMSGEDLINNTRSFSGTSSRTRTHQSSGAMQDLEDVLNDLFTVGK